MCMAIEVVALSKAEYIFLYMTGQIIKHKSQPLIGRMTEYVSL